MLLWVPVALGAPSGQGDPFFTLQERLIADGFDKSSVKAIYASPQIYFDREGIRAYAAHREATLDYGQFLTRASIDKAVDYTGKYRDVLLQTQRDYGVAAEVITAILLVESRLGTSVGKHRVINTLSSLAVLDEGSKRDRLWHDHGQNRIWESRRDFERWALRKADWAYRELKAYLQYVGSQDLDPFFARGSYAGALGFSQFVPSSLLAFGRDGDKDGKVNLYEHVDAIESVANYLREHGWRPGLERREAFRVLLSYNQSNYYAETVLKVAECLTNLRPE
jgi:membrane-bound lytic murein transglycosylase B